MTDTLYSGVNTLVRIKENDLLTRESFELLLKAKNLEAALQQLRKSVYGDMPLAFEQHLMTHLLETYQELLAVAPNPKVIQLFSLVYTYHNLKVLLKSRFTKRDLDYLLVSVDAQELAALKTLVLTGESTELPQVMVDEVVSTLTYYEQYQKIEVVDFFMDNAYLHHLRLLSEQLSADAIVTMMKGSIDLYNLSVILRTKHKKVSRSFLLLVLSTDGIISVDTLVDLAMLGKYNDIIALYCEQAYAETILTILSSDTLTSSDVEYARDALLSHYLEKATLESFGPYPLLAYLYAKEMEVKNIRLILTGKDNDIDEALLRERMRPIYGS